MTYDLRSPDFRRDIFTYYNGEKEEKIPYELKIWKYKIEDGVALLVWAEPEKLNALTLNSIWEMHFLLEEMERNDDVKVVLWTGEGRAFCSGLAASNDALLPTVATEEIREGYMMRGRGQRHKQERDGSFMDIILKGLVLRLHCYAKLSVCAINGLAIGGGLNIGFLLHDFVFCAESGKYRMPFVELGLVAEVGSSWLWPRILGPARAKRIVMLGEWLTAEKALDWNICHEVVADDQLVARALEFSKTLAQQNQASLRLNKVLMNRWLFGSGAGGSSSDGKNSGNNPFHAEDAITALANPRSPHPLGACSQADASAADFYGSYRDQFERHLSMENALMMQAMSSPETIASMNAFKKKYGGEKKKAKM